jgi:hypothetical protein
MAVVVRRNPVWVLLAVLGATLLVASVATAIDRERVIADLRRSPETGAEVLWQRYHAGHERCAGERMGRDGAALLDALEIVESFSNSTMMRALEWVAFHAATAVCCRPLDLTYGPLQIRYSRFQSYQVTGHENIFRSCDARQVASRMLEAELGFTFSPGMELDRAMVLEAARRYNGQLQTVTWTTERLLAHAVYNELVYNLFMEARFAGLRCAIEHYGVGPRGCT